MKNLQIALALALSFCVIPLITAPFGTHSKTCPTITVNLLGIPAATASLAYTHNLTETGEGGGMTGLQYYPLPAPVRLLDTRPGETAACNNPGAPLNGGAPLTLVARGTCQGVTIPTTAQAVVGNATVVNFISGPGYITLYPSNATQPVVSNLNYNANHIVPNAFTVSLGADGALKIFAATSTHFIVDITGYFAPPGVGGLFYHPLPNPVRRLDTRPGETAACTNPGVPLTGGVPLNQQARGSCQGATIPAAAQVIVGNATVVNFQSGPGFITLWPGGASQPVVSNLNYNANHIVPNAFTVRLGGDGTFNIYATGATHFIVDNTGYYSAEATDVNGTGLLYYPLATPVRRLDTRAGETAACTNPGVPLSGGTPFTQAAQGVCQGVTIPATAQAVVGNATVVNFLSGPGFVTLWPAGASQPVVSNLNYNANHIVPNAFVVKLGTGGALNIFATTMTHFIVDLTGFFAPPQTPPPLPPPFFNGPPVFNTMIENPLNPPCGCGGGAPFGGQGCPGAESPGMATGINQDTGGMILLHSGEFIQRKTVLVIPSRELHWNFSLSYRSGITFDGPVGHNWEHNYNRRLFVDSAGNALRMDGAGRADYYLVMQTQSGMSYQAPTGFYTQLMRNPDGSFTERDRSGVRFFYTAPNAQMIARLTEIRDRNENRVQLAYDAQNQLSQVVDPLGRTIVYRYNAQGRLFEVEDFSGRKIKLFYDGDGNLERVTSPAVTGTPNANDFSSGKTTRYTYSSGFSDLRLNHNLLSITAPNEVAAAGPPRVMVTYETDSNHPDVDRVRQITIGGINANTVPAGGAISYQYQALGTAPPNDFDTAVSQTAVTDRNGNRTEYLFNQLGTIVRLREMANRGIRPNDASFFDKLYRFNRDGEVTQTTLPEGNTIQYVYDAQNQDRLQQGNLREVNRLPDSDRGGDQAFIKTTKTYEPIFNQARMMTEARGNDPSYVPQNGGSNSAARYTTTYFFDYQEGNNIAGLANKLGISQAEVSQLLGQAGIPMGLRDLNGDGRTDQIGGNVVKVIHPAVNLLPGSNMAQIEGGTLQPIVELFTYNDFGQLTSRRDPELNITLFNYHPENDPDGDGQNLTPGVGNGPFGYLKEEIRDAVSAPGRDSGANPTPAAIRRQFFYDSVGNVIRGIDGRGIETRYTVNQLNQVVRITRAAAVPAMGSGNPPEPVQLTAFSFIEEFFYDFNDNVTMRRVEDRGDTSNTGGFIERTTKFDILDQPIEMGEETSSSETLITRYRYDANGNRTLVIQPEGNAASTLFDERDLPFQATRGALNATPGTLGAPPGPYNPRGGTPSTTTYNYDLNRSLIELVDAADTDGSTNNNSSIAGVGDVTKYRYDGFDRRVTTTDAVGNMTVVIYDPASNAVKETRSGRIGGQSPTDNSGTNNVPLSVTEYKFDELSRTFQTDQSLFVPQGVVTVRPPNVTEGPLTPGDGKVTTRYEYDRNSLRKFTIDDAIHVYRVEYDGAGRVIKTTDPAGNIVEPAYDDDNNVIETRETDVSQVSGVPNEIFLITYFYDSLNRLQRRVDNLGQTTDYRYDSRNNLVAMADAKGPVSGASITRRAFPNGALTVNTINDLGNVTIYFYDGLNRRTRQEMILTAAGQGDGANIGADIFGVKTTTPTPDTTQGGGDGKITIRSEWDRNSLQRSLTDDNGNQTQYLYDNLNRRLTETKGVCVPPMLADRCDPPTTISYQYDPDDNLVRLTDENGSVTQYTYDAINRRIACQITRAPGVVGTTAVSYQYDGLSRLTRATDNNEPAPTDDDSTITYAYDSLSRVIEETQKIGALPARAISSGWNADNLRTALSYPNDRVVTFTYDGLDRLNTIADQGAAQPIADYDFIGAGRVLQRRHPINGTRMTYLNDAGNVDVGYDGLRRPVQLRHLRNDNSLIAGFTHTYDRTNNKLNEGKLHNSPNNENYGYDSAYRLTRFNRAVGGIAPLHSNWTLDGAGNWRLVDSETRQHSSFNEITQRDSGRVTTTILSDNNGNETDDGTFLFTWDAQNRLRTVTPRAGGSSTTYSYDAAGRRIRKVVGNSGSPDATTNFYLDGWREIEERNGADALGQQYVYGVYIDEPLVLDRNLNGDGTAIGSGDQRLFYHQNTLYSVFALTDSTGTILEGYQYDAYGRQTVFAPGSNGVVDFGGDDIIRPDGLSGIGNSLMFTGRRLDPETGRSYSRMRYLSGEQGRFVQRDPLGMWTDPANLGNAYAYGGNSPINPRPPVPRYLPNSGTWTTRGFLEGDNQPYLPSPLEILTLTLPRDLYDPRPFTTPQGGAAAVAGRALALLLGTRIAQKDTSIYRGPNRASGSIGSAPFRTQVQILDFEGNWVRVRLESGVIGYIRIGALIESRKFVPSQEGEAKPGAELSEAYSSTKG